MIREDLDKGEPLKLRNGRAVDHWHFYAGAKDFVIIYRMDRGTMIKQTVNWGDIETTRRTHGISR